MAAFEGNIKGWPYEGPEKTIRDFFAGQSGTNRLAKKPRQDVTTQSTSYTPQPPPIQIHRLTQTPPIQTPLNQIPEVSLLLRLHTNA